MTVVTRSVLWTKEIPRGWKLLNIRQGVALTPYFISPEGKRFATLEAAKEHIADQVADLSDTENNDLIHSPKRRKRKLSINESPSSKRLKFDSDVVEEILDLSLPIEIQRRRKLMAARSPFRNLLKRTLVRNHVRSRGRGTWKTKSPTQVNKPPTTPQTPPPPQSSASQSKSFDPSSSSKNSEPLPVLKEKVETGSISNLKTPEREKKDDLSPPRNRRRDSIIFTPPNLTPPVTRRLRSSISFTSPNQRPLVKRKRRNSSCLQPNFDV